MSQPVAHPARSWATYVAIAATLLAPLLLQNLGTHWVRVVDTCLLYILLALGLNIVLGYAGLLDLGYVAFYAMGAYLYALLSSSHLAENFPWIALLLPGGLHVPWWLIIPLSAALAGLLGILLGAPTLKLRGDYLAMITLGFGEMIRILINNLSQPINITNGAKGIGPIDPINIFGLNLGQPLRLGNFEIASVSLYYYLLLTLVVLTIIITHRLQHSRIGRAWMAIREDETAAAAMGIHLRNLKLLAFGIGASFGGVAGVMFASFQSFISPEAFTLHESVMIVAMVVFGGIGHIKGVILGAVVLTALPEILRYLVNPIQEMTGGRIDAGILRQLLVAFAMISVMLYRTQGLWPAPDSARRI